MKSNSYKPDSDQNISICSLTKLPKYSRKEWTDIHVHDKFNMSFSILGDNIVVVRSFGRITFDIVAKIKSIANGIIAEVFDPDCDIVFIVDICGIKSVSVRGRKHYIEFLLEQKKLVAIVLCASSPLMMLSVKLAHRFNTAKFIVAIEKDITGAIKQAVKLLALRAKKKELQASLKFPLLAGESEQSIVKKCPVTGLPVVEKPEWTRVDLGGPSITFCVIGGMILSSTLYDWVAVDIDICRRMFEVRKKVIEAMFGNKGQFVEIRDYTNFNPGASKKMRSEFISLMRPDQDRLLAYIGYNAPLFVKISFNVGKKLYASPFPLEICENYSETINYSIMSLKKHGFKLLKSPVVIKKEGWGLELDGFSVQYEIIDCDIIHIISKGFLRLKHVEPLYKLQCKVVEEAKLDNKPHYCVNQVSGLHGLSFKARKKYFECTARWMNGHPDCRMVLIYGANRMIKIGLAISNYISLFKVNVCDSLKDALSLIEKDKVDMVPGRMDILLEKNHGNDIIQSYSREILDFLGNINWEFGENNCAEEKKNHEHPFKNVFDSITLIKSDIDELFRDHEKIKKDLEESKKIANVLTQEIIKAQENERQRIARDLHDNVAQELASLIITNDGLFDGYEDIPHDVRRRAMKNSRTLKRAIESIRELAYDLRPPSLDQLGLVKTIFQYCNDFSETNMLKVDFYSAGVDKLELDFDTEINIYRVIQEALNNIKKHANASYVTIHLITSFPHIILKIEDDGAGFDLETRMIEALNEKRMGLQSMEERAKLMSGEFSIKSLVGKGTMIRMKLPYE